MADYGKKNPRDMIFAMDMLHLIIGILVVILAVMAFLSPEEHMLFFPVIFFLASILNFVSGIHSIKMSGRDNKRRLGGWIYCILGLLLFIITIISAISIL